MTDAMLLLAPAALAGVAFGLAYFGALWLTVRRALRSERALAWLGLSAAIRIALLLLGFLAVMDGTWERLVACLVGFVAVRIAASALARTPGPAVRAAP